MADDPRKDETRRAEDPAERARHIVDRELRRQDEAAAKPNDKTFDKA